MRLKHLLSVFLTLLTLSVGQMWGAVDDVVASVNPTTDLGAGQNYNPASNDDWAVNVTNNSAFGTNAKSSNNDKLKLSNNSSVSTRNTAIATALAAYTEAEFTVNTQYVAALIGLTELSNVGKVGVTYGGTNGGNPDDMWVLYSTNSGSTYSVAGHTSSVSSGTNITFTSTISSAQYAVVFKRSAAFGIKTTPVITFYEGATTPSYTITAQSNNNSLGTVTLDGSVITATPAENCRIASTAYTVTNGTATVVRGTDTNINKFTVTPSSTCTVCINFEEIPSHTVTWSANGSTTSESYQEGATITFPNTASGCEGGSFRGWTATPIVGTSDETPDFVTSANMGDANITYYAVFATIAGDVEETTDTERGSTEQPFVANTGWTATVGGTYTTNTNYGNSSPSIKFSTNGHYVQSPTYSGAITAISYWYKPQNATGSISTFVSTDGSIWTELTQESVSFSSSSTAGTKSITVSSSSGYKAVKIVYNKTTSNVAIDDIAITYGGVSYSDYRTSCCTSLASIKGSFLGTTHFGALSPEKFRPERP